MQWKFYVVVFSVLCVLLLWTLQLSKENKTLEIQNCTLQQTIEINNKAVQEKLKRSKDELGRLQKELDSVRDLDSNWLDHALPVSVHNRLYELCNSHRDSCSVVGRETDKL